ncbi:MAG TPA: hypothetical protein VGG28_32405 [Kofleriaceae bacterium]|jgi:hypothetical protein
MRVLVALLFVVVSSAGCLAIQGLVGTATVARPTARRLWTDTKLGGACKQFVSEGSRVSRPRKLSRLDAAAFVACADKTDGVGALMDDHFSFDDQLFDHLTAGIIVVDCALDEFDCGKNSVLAISSGYAKRVDPAIADRALAAAGASKAVRDEFHSRLEAARKTIAERVAKLDPQVKAIWLDPSQQVWRDRQAYATRWNGYYKQLAPLMDIARTGAGDVPAALHGAQALRGRFLDGCTTAECALSPFVLEATRAIELLAVRTNDVRVAEAEQQLLTGTELSSQYFGTAMFAVLWPSIERAGDKRRRYEALQQQGGDAAIVASAEPIKVHAEEARELWGARRVADLTVGLDQSKTKNVRADVVGVRRDGANATIFFADSAYEWTENNCHETDKIDSVRADGKIDYRVECPGGATHVEYSHVAPIHVPAAQASGLHGGETVEAWVNDAEVGEISFVHRKDAVVQIRDHALRTAVAHGYVSSR